MKTTTKDNFCIKNHKFKVNLLQTFLFNIYTEGNVIFHGDTMFGRWENCLSLDLKKKCFWTSYSPFLILCIDSRHESEKQNEKGTTERKLKIKIKKNVKEIWKEGKTWKKVYSLLDRRNEGEEMKQKGRNRTKTKCKN